MFRLPRFSILCLLPLAFQAGGAGTPDSEAWPVGIRLPAERVGELWGSDPRVKQMVNHDQPDVWVWTPEGAERDMAERLADGPLDPWTLIRSATEVPAGEHRKYFWIADREQGEAWLRLHDMERLKAERANAGR